MSDYSVIVVGAGVSGLYAAWRLCVDTPTLMPSQIAILEASDRTGGRLRTWTLNDFDPSLPADPACRAELGGMRILNYNIYACSLVEHLGLGLVSFPADVSTNWHFLRGETILGGNYPGQTIYKVAPNEAQWTPGDVVYEPLVLQGQIVPQNLFPTSDGTITQRDFVNSVMRDVAVDGVPAWKLGFWNSILSSGQALNPSSHDVSYQAYAYFVEAGAYDTVPANWNASVAFSNLLSDFSNSPSYWAVTDGYEQIPNTLATSLTTAGVKIALGSQVTGLFKTGDGNFVVEVEDGPSLTADQVVLALPPRALELLALNDILPSEAVSAPLAGQIPSIRQSAPIPLFKIFLVYDSDWWSGPVVEDWPAFTRMTTDMPMRQIYNFGKAESGDTTYHLFQAVYCDSLKGGYWAGLMPQEAESKGEDVNTDIFARIENLAGSSIATGTLQFQTGDKLSDFPLFEAAHQQFVTMVEAVAAGQTPQGPAPTPVVPIAGAAMNWATDPFGGGVNFWNVGVELDDGQGGGAYWAMMNPAADLFVIGEGYSLYQGWVEGALWSAEDMLERYFGLTAPSWLNTTPYSGASEHVPVTAAKGGLPARA